MKLWAFLLLGATAVIWTGCDDSSVAEKERGERAETLFAEAVKAEQSGDYAAAETLYRTLLRKDAENASAYLGLAILQQDYRENFLEAAHNYQAYLDLSPDSEKASMVRDRMEGARARLATELAGEVIAREQRQLMTERDTLRQTVADKEGEAAQLKRTLAQRNEQITELEARIANLQRIIEELKRVEVTPAPAAPATPIDKAALTSEAVPNEPTATESSADIDAIRAMAEAMKNEEDGGISKEQAAQNAATREAVEGKEDGPKLSDSPKSGFKYVVRPGDTFSKLSREAYGNASGWTKIRDANRSTTNPNGRLRAGETILIP